VQRWPRGIQIRHGLEKAASRYVSYWLARGYQSV
jgi:hypothetical protein